MAGRDPTRPQLEFPELVAELITQLRLTGQLGRLNFSDEVVPAFLIGSRGINFGGDLPAFASAASFSGDFPSPPANTVVFDTGALPAGTYDILASIHSSGSVLLNASALNLQHRDAANAATLANLLSLSINTVDHATNISLPLIGYTIGLNERIRLLSPVLQAVTGGVSGSLFMQVRPTP